MEKAYEEEYEDMKTKELCINEKTKKILAKLGIKYVTQLVNIDIRRLDELKMLGEKYIVELENELYALGFDLKNDKDDTDTMDKFEQWREKNSIKKLESKNTGNVYIIQDKKNSEDKDKNKEVRNNKGER